MENISISSIMQQQQREPPADVQPETISSCDDYHTFKLKQCEWYNRAAGADDKTGIQCSRCNNKGRYASLDDDDNMIISECSCMKMRRSVKALQQSGLEEQTKSQTFDSFIAFEDWQQRAKAAALMFLRESHAGKWFYIGGQSGCGKTHLCTAICSKLIATGREVRYAVWFDLFHELQSLQFKEDYKKRFNDYANADVLYIDDFLKDYDQKKNNSQRQFAFEIINARYIRGKTTVISSEFHMDVLSKIDRATAGRIAEKSKGFLIQIKYIAGRDWRQKVSNDETA